jgi:hypothetical protein
MSWLKWLQGSSKWTIKGASGSAAEPRTDGGLHFEMDAKGNLSYSYFYVVLNFESKPNESMLREIFITNRNGEKVGNLFGFKQKGTEVTLVFKGNWTNLEPMSLSGLNQAYEIGKISEMALLQK